MQRVIHLIPYDGIGGVETAARSMSSISSPDLDFQVETVFSSSVTHKWWATLNPLYLMGAVYRLWRAKPAVLVVSLWRACMVGVAVKFFRPRLRLVVFLHLPEDVHGFDHLFTSFATRMACRVWGDSHATLARRLPRLTFGKRRVISFVTARIEPLPAEPARPIFIFWGHIHTQKRLDRALRIFAGVHARQEMARFFVIGPDGGDLERVRCLATELGVGHTVEFLGGTNFDAIRKVAKGASFYLQTSALEGMAISVVEAMQLGLVPVVTAVGEIAHYCRHNENALIVSNEADAVADILSLLEDDRRFQAIRQQSTLTWLNQPLYTDSVVQACREVLDIDKVKRVT